MSDTDASQNDAPPPETDHTVADAAPRNWVDRFAPEPVRPYLRLARWDRPIGTWLLVWPCFWGLTLGAGVEDGSFPSLWLMLLFTLGAMAMRGAGCTYNDIIDRDIDAQVERTRSRPLPSGQVTIHGATAFLGLQCGVGLFVLLQLNDVAIWLGFASLLLVAAYPFMKRVTWWPQAWLGLTFNWGVLMGYAAETGAVSLAALLFYGGAILWTIGYDTIYAHQDKDDDALIGVKSSALRLGAATKPWLIAFYGGAVVLFGFAGWVAELGYAYLLGLSAMAGHLIWQIRTLDIDQPDLCLTIFKSNREAGGLLFAALILGTLF